MNGKWLALAMLVVVGGVVWSSCGRSQELVSIAIQPVAETIGASNIPVNFDAGQQVQLRALGTYIHPPVTKDITNQVTWASNDIQMFTVTSAGMLTATGKACGGTLVSATVNTGKSAGGLSSSGAIVTGYMTANVVCFTGSGGGGGNDALTVTFLGSGSGSVTSNPVGVSCFSPGPCVGPFAVNSTVALTAAPSGSSVFGGWIGCDTSSSTNPCSVTMNANRTVTVTFN